MGKILDIADRVWTGELRGMHPFAPLNELEEVADGSGFVSSVANGLRSRACRYGELPPGAAGARDGARMGEGAARHRRVHARARRSRVRRGAVRGRGTRERMEGGARDRARGAAGALRSLQGDG